MEGLGAHERTYHPALEAHVIIGREASLGAGIVLALGGRRNVSRGGSGGGGGGDRPGGGVGAAAALQAHEQAQGHAEGQRDDQVALTVGYLHGGYA